MEKGSKREGEKQGGRKGHKVGDKHGVVEELELDVRVRGEADLGIRV